MSNNGAGIGDIATSVLLSERGYKADIYEKTISAGGRCGQIVRDGHRFVVGATMMLIPEVRRDVLGSLALTMDDLNVRPMDEIYTLWFDDGTRLAFTTYRERMRQQLEKMEPGYRLSQEIIFDLNMMVYERIDPEHGTFSSEELNPTPAETREQVRGVIVRQYC